MTDPASPRVVSVNLGLGTYLRIVEPGEVAAGDSIEVVDHPDHDVNIALLSRVLFEDGSLGPRVLEAEALTDAWREHGERLAAKYA